MATVGRGWGCCGQASTALQDVPVPYCRPCRPQGKTLTTAWVGDSRGVLGREGKKGWEAIDLTTDHKPTAPEEKARILKANGRVERCAMHVLQHWGLWCARIQGPSTGCWHAVLAARGRPAGNPYQQQHNALRVMEFAGPCRAATWHISLALSLR